MKKIKYLVPFLLCIVVVFSSCSFKNLTPSELLKPPATAEKIKNVMADIKAEIPEETFPITPTSGEYRSSINFIDLNNDKKEEVVYLYSTSIEKINPVICFLSLEGEHYKKSYSINSIAVGIDFISFIDYNFDNIIELSVGYLQVTTEQKLLSVYSLKENTTQEILSSTYSIHSVIKKDDNTNSIFIASLTTKDLPAHGRLFEYTNEKFKMTSECEMNGTITSYASVLTDKYKEQTRIIVNENVDSNTLATEIIGISAGILTNYTFINGKQQFPEQLLRSSNIYSQDIDKDGMVEFSAAIQAQAKIQTVQSNVRVSEWFSFDNEKFISKMHLLLNTTERYYLIFPEKWLPIFTIKTDITGSNYNFYYKIQPEDEELLFSILSMSQQDFEAKQTNEEYKVIKLLPDRAYIAYLPKNVSAVAKNIQPTIEELEKLFVQTTIKQR